MSEDKMAKNDNPTTSDALYKAQYLREKTMREQAEFVLETKEQELILANQSLETQSFTIKKLESEMLELATQLDQTKDKLKQFSHFDPLTQLPNRTQFDVDLKRELSRAKRYQRKIALLHLDIDFFKKVNDAHGHDIGDLLLKEASARLNKLLRTEDCIARLGDDEFAIILTEIHNSHDAGVTANRIVSRLSEPYQLAGHIIVVGMSIGIACYPDAGEDVAVLHQSADIALHTAKGMGRNTYQFFTLGLQEEHANRLELEAELHFALERKEFFLLYQPRFDLQTAKMIGMEVLLRWQHPLKGVLLPKDFIAIAEETGLIAPIGTWVIKTACQQFATWREHSTHLDCVLAINVSPKQFQYQNFVDIVTQILDEKNISANLVEFEITEMAVMKYLGKIETALFKLRDLGVHFSIDDFGTGYSSFARLKQLPIQSIKIDRSFVNDIDVKVNENLIIKSTIELGKEMGFNVVAEGVETENQLSFLIKSQCPQAQGYYYSKPLTVDEMTHYLSK